MKNELDSNNLIANKILSLAGSRHQSQWIDVKTPPKNTRRVLVKNNAYTSIIPHSYYANGWCSYDNTEILSDITHWMDYPE